MFRIQDKTIAFLDGQELDFDTLIWAQMCDESLYVNTIFIREYAICRYCGKQSEDAAHTCKTCGAELKFDEP